MMEPVAGAVITTQRLFLRILEQADLPAMKRVLQDEQTMYAYEHAFDDQEAQEWLDRQRARYVEYFGLWGVFFARFGPNDRSVRRYDAGLRRRLCAGDRISAGARPLALRLCCRGCMRVPQLCV